MGERLEQSVVMNCLHDAGNLSVDAGDITIAPATMSDLSAVFALYRALYGIDEHEGAPVDDRPIFERCIQQGLMLLARKVGVPVGYCAASMDPMDNYVFDELLEKGVTLDNSVYVYFRGVLPHVRERGIGTMLRAQCLSLAKKKALFLPHRIH